MILLAAAGDWHVSTMTFDGGVMAHYVDGVRQGSGAAKLSAALDDSLPDDCVRVAAAHASTCGLGAMFGSLEVAKAPVEKVA